MAKLSDIAKVLIELRTSSIGKASFGIPMVAGRLGAQFPDRVYTFESYNEAEDLVGADNTTHLPDSVIKAVQKAFSQTPRIEKVLVGNLLETSDYTVTISDSSFTGSGGTAASGTTFKITVDGVEYSYATTDATDTRGTVTTKLAGVLNAALNVSTNYTVVADASTFTISIKPKAATITYSVAAGTNTSITETKSLRTPIDSQLTDIQGYDDTWYGFTVIGASDTDIPTIAAWAEAAEPFVQYWAASDTSTIWTTPVTGATDVLSELQKRQYERTIFTPTKNADELDAVAAMARFYVGEPGSIVAGLKTLVGISPSKFTPQQAKNIRDKGGNTYEQYASNVYLFNPGKAVSGRWADEVRDRDWLVNYIQTSMASALIRAPKVPYTNPGITSLVNVLNGCLVYAQQQGVIAPDQIDSLGNTVPGFVITAPNALDVPFDIKATRVLKLSFVALLAGAIQSVEINGVLTYSYDGA